MKKIAVVLFLGVAVFQRGAAQGIGSLFSQGSTKLQYYAEQIAALQLYIGKAEKGFQVMESGLNDIKNIKQGDFNLHSTFFSSLESINPSVSGMAQVAEIIALQVSIVNQFSGSLKRWRSGNSLSQGDLEYAGQVYANICNAGLTDVNALMNLVTAGTLKMTDDQRIQGIQALDEDMKEQYAFTLDFTNHTELLSQQRQAGNADAGSLKALYGLP